MPPTVITEATDRVASESFTSDEMLVPDARGRLTPAQMVEHKLVAVLQTSPMLVSLLQDTVRRRPR